MKQVHQIVSIVAVVLLAMGCRKDPPVPPPASPIADPARVMELSVMAHWDGSPLQGGEPYVNILDHKVLVEVFRAYLGEIELYGPDGAFRCSDIELFNLTSGPQKRWFELDSGSWNGLRLGLGVPSLLNNSDPAIYPQGHPLSVSQGTYWTWTTGYRFVMFDGRYDSIPDGTATILPVFSIHPGLDVCYRALDFDLPGPGMVQVGDTMRLALSFDVSRFFHSANDTLDLMLDNQAHGDNIDLATRFMDLMVEATTLE